MFRITHCNDLYYVFPVLVTITSYWLILPTWVFLHLCSATVFIQDVWQVQALHHFLHTAVRETRTHTGAHSSLLWTLQGFSAHSQWEPKSFQWSALCYLFQLPLARIHLPIHWCFLDHIKLFSPLGCSCVSGFQWALPSLTFISGCHTISKVFPDYPTSNSYSHLPLS
jgi:hypothetical protein